MRILLLLLFVSFQAFGQSHYSNIFKKKSSLKNVAASPYTYILPIDAFNNTASFYQPSTSYYDGDINTPYEPGGATYTPTETFIDLGGNVVVNHLVVFDKNTGASFTVKSGDSLTKLKVDTTIILNTGENRLIDIKNKNVKYLSYVINDDHPGPAEVRIYGIRVSTDIIPPITLRPNMRLDSMMGWNADEITPTYAEVGFPGNSIREYEYTSKFHRKRNEDIFSLSPDYDQGQPLDQNFQTITNQGKFNNLVVFDLLGYDSVWVQDYENFGIGYNKIVTERFLTATPGIDKTRPIAWDDVSRMAFQMGLRWGRDTTKSPSLARLEPTNVVKIGLNRLTEIEFGNEHDKWWNSDTNTFLLPFQAAAKAFAIRDGDEGRLGPRRGIKNADSTFLIVQDALADFNAAYNKIIHLYSKEKRSDHRFPYDITNAHSYLTRLAGQHNQGDKGVAPEQYRRPGYKAIGLEEYALEHGDYELRHLSYVKRYYSEFGYDTNKDSQTGVPMLTKAQGDTAKNHFSTWDVQGMLLQRHFVALMKCRAFDKFHVYSWFDYAPYANTLPDYASDIRNINNDDGDYDPYSTSGDFAQSGVVNPELYWVQGNTSSPISINSSTIGQDVTFTLPPDRAFWVFKSPLTIRYTGGSHNEYQYQENKLTGDIVSQNDSVLVLHVTGYQVSPSGSEYQISSASEWRFDTPLAPKTAYTMIKNQLAVMGDCKFVADSSKGQYKDYRFANGLGKQVSMVWLPTSVWNEITNIQINLGSGSSLVREKINRSNYGATVAKTAAAGKITTNISEMPRFFYFNSTNPTNLAPTANAGQDLNVSYSKICLTGAGSDKDGSVSTWAWTKVSGPNNPTFITSNKPIASITGMVTGTYVFRLTATDDQGLSASDEITVNVLISSGGGTTSSNTAPTANAGSDQNILTSTATISGSGTDSDGSIVSYAWSKVSGGSAALANANSPNLSLSSLVTGSYTFRLTVTDNLGASAIDDVDIIVNIGGGNNPVVHFSGNITINNGNTSVNLNDPNSTATAPATIVSYRWTMQSGPNTPTFANQNTDHCQVTNLVNGTYVFRLTVTDSDGLIGSDVQSCFVSGVSSGGNASPFANAGIDQSITSSVTTLNGNGTDPDGSISSYSWSKLSGPNSPTETGVNSSTLSLSGLVTGNYVYQLTVTDNLGAPATDNITITVNITGGGTTSASQLIVTNLHSTIGGGSGQDIVTEVYLPPGYAEGSNFPVIVFCHGLGEKYGTGGRVGVSANIANLNNAALPKYLATGHDIPFVVIMPQISSGEFDSYDGATFQNGLLTHEARMLAINNYKGDPQRCHLTGLSLGGQTMCSSVIAYPGDWATFLPISTYALDESLAGPVRAVCWWHMGMNDAEYSAPYNQVNWINALNNGGHIPFTSRYTFYAGQGHSGNVWDNVYFNTDGGLTLSTASSVPNNHAGGDIYAWMLQYKIVNGTVQLVNP